MTDAVWKNALDIHLRFNDRHRLPDDEVKRIVDETCVAGTNEQIRQYPQPKPVDRTDPAGEH